MDPRFHVVAQLLTGHVEAAAETLRRQADPAAFATFVDRQHLRFFFSRWVEQGVLEPVMSPAWIARLVNAARVQRARQEWMVTELGAVTARFEARGIEYALLKGPYLADRFYGGIGNRSYADLDLLVRRADLVRAGAALEDAGYARKSRVLLTVPITTRFAHAFDYRGLVETPQGRQPLTIDLHWGLWTHPSFRIDYDRVWRERARWPIAGRETVVLGDGDEILASILTILRDGERGAARLKLFVDLFHLARVTDDRIDWEGFFAQRARERLLRPSVGVLQLFFDLIPCAGMVPRLADAVRARQSMVRTGSGADWILHPAGLSLRHKVWSARLYECSPAISLAWWVVSLPARLLVYHQGRLRRRLNMWFGRPGPPS